VALGKLLTPVCLCHQAVKFGIGQGGDLFRWESNRRPGGSNSSLPPGFMTNVTCGLIVKKLGSPNARNRVWDYLFYIFLLHSMVLSTFVTTELCFIYLCISRQLTGAANCQ